MIKTHGSPTDLQNGAVSAIVGSWNDAARLDFQMHIARRFQNGGLGPHFFQHRNRTFSCPWLLRTWRRHLCSQLCCSWGIQLTRSLLNFCCCFWSVNVAVNFFWFINYQQMSVRRLSYWLHWANDAVWYVPFFVFHCQTFDSSYCFRQLISGTFMVFWSQDCQIRVIIRPRCLIPTIIFLRYFGWSQTNTDKITRKGGCHLLFNCWDYPLVCHSRWFHTLQHQSVSGWSWVNWTSIVIRTFRIKWSVSLRALLEIIMW